MESEDKKTIYTRRNLLLFISIIIIILILVVGCQLFKKKDDKPANPDVIEVTSINVDVANLDLKVGETKKINATVYPMDATNQTLAYSIDNDNVATVDAQGNVTGISPGTAVITVKTNNGISTNVNVIVSEEKPEEVVQKPTIKFGTPSGTKGKNNWYISNVTVKVTLTGSNTAKYCLSGGIECTPKTTIKSGQKITVGEGIWRIFVKATNSAGSTTSKTELIHVDVSKPTILLTGVSGTDGVTIVATCKDSTSGVAKCAESSEKSVTINNVKETTTYIVTDSAGNTTSKQTTIGTVIQYRRRKCASYKWSEWGTPTSKLVNPDDCNKNRSKAEAESGGYDTYQTCVEKSGGSTACVNQGLEPECKLMRTYTRSITGCNWGSWSEWGTTEYYDVKNKYDAEKRTMYVMN